jgi:hypothetical protein
MLEAIPFFLSLAKSFEMICGKIIFIAHLRRRLHNSPELQFWTSGETFERLSQIAYENNMLTNAFKSFRGT